MSDVAAEVVRFVCSACGESASSRSAAWVANAEATHHCPTPEQPARAARGDRSWVLLAEKGLTDG